MKTLILKLIQYSNRYKVILALAILALSCCIYWKNPFHRVAQEDFAKFEHSSEAYVVSRLNLSRHQGLASEGALLGRFEPLDKHVELDKDSPWVEHQYDLFTKNSIVDNKFFIYTSQVGFQGILFSGLDNLLGHSLSIEALYGINSFLLALIVVFFFWQLSKEFNALVAFTAVFPLFYSSWMTYFGRNLYWSLWSFYLPFVISYWLSSRARPAWGYLLLFAALCLRFASGFEYTSTVIVASLVPVLYFSLKQNQSWKTIFLKLVAVGSIGVLAFFCMISLWYLQLEHYYGSSDEALKTMAFHIFKRTHALDSEAYGIFAESLKANVFYVILLYFKKGFLVFPVLMGLSLYYLKKQKLWHKHRTLIYTTLFSFLGPISWFVLGKGHSYIHTHINHILWYIVYIPYANALTMVTVQEFFKISSKEAKC